MLIRKAVLNDFREIKRLYAQLAPSDPEILDGRDSAAYESIISADHLHLFAGEVDDKLIATCYLNIIPNLTRSVSPYAIIENVVTDKSYRSQGYGKTVLKHALEFAWSQGCYKVMLQTGSKKESTHNFYKACGFNPNDKFAFVARPI